MRRGGFIAVVAAVVVVAFGATWLVSAAPSGAGQPRATTSTLSPPLAQARTGQLQCYGPNVEKRTCQSLAGYATSASGAIENTATVLVSVTPAVTMQTVTQVAIKAEQVCGDVTEQDIATATFTLDGDPATPAQSARLRKMMVAAMSRFLDREVCTSYVPEGEAFIATATVDGAPDPRFNQRVIWVSPSDGYTIGP